MLHGYHGGRRGRRSPRDRPVRRRGGARRRRWSQKVVEAVRAYLVEDGRLACPTARPCSTAGARVRTPASSASVPAPRSRRPASAPCWKRRGCDIEYTQRPRVQARRTARTAPPRAGAARARTSPPRSTAACSPTRGATAGVDGAHRSTCRAAVEARRVLDRHAELDRRPPARARGDVATSDRAARQRASCRARRRSRRSFVDGVRERATRAPSSTRRARDHAARGARARRSACRSSPRPSAAAAKLAEELGGAAKPSGRGRRRRRRRLPDRSRGRRDLSRSARPTSDSKSLV